MKSILVLLYRHAHRDLTDRSEDNGLSAKGIRQREELTRDFLGRWGTRGLRWKILSSPKLRCQETVEDIAASLGRTAEVWDLLDEEAASACGGVSFWERVA